MSSSNSDLTHIELSGIFQFHFRRNHNSDNASGRLSYPNSRQTPYICFSILFLPQQHETFGDGKNSAVKFSLCKLKTPRIPRIQLCSPSRILSSLLVCIQPVQSCNNVLFVVQNGIPPSVTSFPSTNSSRLSIMPLPSSLWQGSKSRLEKLEGDKKRLVLVWRIYLFILSRSCFCEFISSERVHLPG